ncbi:MAG: histidine kinase dimerization/phospho-acceptor domain-containing protein, partial [Nitrososphaerales archaeon]
MRTTRVASRRNELLAVALVALAAVAISAFVYGYSNTVADNIAAASLQSTETNAQIQASDMDHILLNELGSITSNLQLVAASSPVQAGNTSEAIPIFQRAANSTAELTYDYFWIDRHGDLLLSRNATGEVPTVAGANLTSRPYFVGAKQTGGIYYGALTQNLLNQSVVNIALPVYSTSDRAFEGVVGVTIDLATMGAFVQSQLSPLLKSSMGMLDSQGNVLFSGNPQLEGKSIFGTQVQSLLPANLKGQFDSFINSSLRGVAGVGEISYAGNSSTIAYQPILVAGPQDQGALHEFGVLYVSAPDVLAASQTAQVDQFRALTGTLIFGIGVLSVAAGGIILGWNRRLDRAVKQKTSDLVSANEQLRQRTEELARANLEISSQADTQRDLFNITAHELRTPTQSILANAELMQDALQPVIDTSGAVSPERAGGQPRRVTEEELSDLAASTYRNAQRLQKLIQNILTVVRIESKNLHLQTESLDLDEKIGHAITDTQNVVETNGRRYSDYRIVYEPAGGPLR